MKEQRTAPEQKETAHWTAVFSLFLGVTALICAEFLPISLLTPMAADLRISEGLAGQSVAAVGLFAVITSLLLSPLTKNTNRRFILLLFSVLLIVSNSIAAFAGDFWLLLLGRAVLGICVGGFWSLSSAVVLQLVPKDAAAKALSLIYAGVSVATLLSIPLASYFGAIIGWRNVFLLAALLGLAALICQYCSLPSLPPQSGSSFTALARLLKKSWVLPGLAGMIFSFGGYHVFFTYLRPFLEQNLSLRQNSLTFALALFALANCLGTFAAGFMLKRQFRRTHLGCHIVLAAVALVLLFNGSHGAFNYVLVMLWGFVFGIIPVAWSVWIVRTLADKAELGGGLMVASVQFSIGLGATLGGIIFDRIGIEGNFAAACGLSVCAVLAIAGSFRLFFKAEGRQV